MIQWFPGHMAKAKNEIIARLKLVDIAFELIDARIPLSSRNPLFSELLGNRPRLIILTKSDLADEKQTKLWIKAMENQYPVLAIDALSGRNVGRIIQVAMEILKPKLEREKAKGLKERPLRAMILGIPNVGKSTLLNRLVKKKVAEVGNRPGVTKAQQWVRINPQLELLDTPGVLWPKFEDQKLGIHLALTGAIRDEILKSEDLGLYLLDFLKQYYPEVLSRYQVDPSKDNWEIIEEIAKIRGFLQEDYVDKAFNLLINDFRNNRLGRITLDRYQKEE
ncbi:MAG: ribosome biogenesis GTPase YlqF [Acholeplasmataceae bacterium]|nr:ribosome biogenesis GTPase YlqF [Acholeplasmataceae bacterium]